jgi:Ca2+-binding RTX toxin-like protein
MATVRVPTNYPTIAAAMGFVGPGDTIMLDPGYGNEIAAVTVEGLTVSGDASSLNIGLTLGAGVSALTLGGTASIAVHDNAGNNVIVGNGGNNAITVTGGVDVVDGLSGNDRLIVDYSNAILPIINPLTNPIHAGTVDGYAGAFANVVLQNVVFDNIESFDVRGGAANDSIMTGGGDDLLEGGPGADQLNGAAGNDTASYAHSSAGVTVFLSANASNSGGDATGDVLTGIEGLIGSAFDDFLIGFSDPRACTLAGGNGNDMMIVNNASSVVIEAANAGLDIASATVDYTIPTNVEGLYMVGSGLTGTGSGGNEVLLSAGGANRLIGLGGDDLYYVNNTGDVVTEATGAGHDIVAASVNYTIAANVEGLYMVGSGLTGTGSGGNDILLSAGGANTLIGLGGNDVYYVNNAGDVVTEAANAGTDTALATVNYTIPVNVEVLYVTGSGLTGTGSSGNDKLVTVGANTLIGGAGDDSFVFFAGSANGAAIGDFDGNQIGEQDQLTFSGFGTAAQGATFTQIGITNQWLIHSGLDGHNEIITFSNGASVLQSDYLFV